MEKQLTLWLRYWVNSAAGITATYIIFVLVIFGGEAAAPDVLGESLPAIIVGFFVWGLAFGAFQGPADSLMEEAQWGTLEQLYMTPQGLGTILAFQSIVSLALSFAIGLGLLALMMVTAGRYLIVDILTVAPIALFTVCTAAGLGFAMGGLAIIYKRIENVFLIIQFVFIGILMAPPTTVALNLLPLKLGFEMLTRAMESGTRVWEFPVTDLGMLVGVGIGYLVAGWLALRYALRVARSRGLMGDY